MKSRVFAVETEGAANAIEERQQRMTWQRGGHDGVDAVVEAP
jgi:hypothetical protein